MTDITFMYLQLGILTCTGTPNMTCFNQTTAFAVTSLSFQVVATLPSNFGSLMSYGTFQNNSALFTSSSYAIQYSSTQGFFCQVSLASGITIENFIPGVGYIDIENYGSTIYVNQYFCTGNSSSSSFSLSSLGIPSSISDVILQNQYQTVAFQAAITGQNGTSYYFVAANLNNPASKFKARLLQGASQYIQVDGTNPYYIQTINDTSVGVASTGSLNIITVSPSLVIDSEDFIINVQSNMMWNDFNIIGNEMFFHGLQYNIANEEFDGLNLQATEQMLLMQNGSYIQFAAGLPAVMTSPNAGSILYGPPSQANYQLGDYAWLLGYNNAQIIQFQASTNSINTYSTASNYGYNNFVRLYSVTQGTNYLNFTLCVMNQSLCIVDQSGNGGSSVPINVSTTQIYDVFTKYTSGIMAVLTQNGTNVFVNVFNVSNQSQYLQVNVFAYSSTQPPTYSRLSENLAAFAYQSENPSSSNLSTIVVFNSTTGFQTPMLTFGVPYSNIMFISLVGPESSNPVLHLVLGDGDEQVAVTANGCTVTQVVNGVSGSFRNLNLNQYMI